MSAIQESLDAAKYTNKMITKEGAATEAGLLFSSEFSGLPAKIIADEVTWKLLGTKLTDSFIAAEITVEEPHIFPNPPVLKAHYKHVGTIISSTKNPSTILIALGSGTINDLVKRASFERNNSYMVVGTAASMDGYCSSGAALLKDGRKQTMECPAPRVVLADLSILKNAPAKMTAAGYADLASKLTAGADWILADFVGEDPIDQKTWNMIHPDLIEWLKKPEDLMAGDEETFLNLFQGLNICGFAMQYLERSRAASGAEHLFSHVWEMSGKTYKDGSSISHGFKVAMGILTVSALYETFFNLSIDQIDPEKAVLKLLNQDERDEEVERYLVPGANLNEYLTICREKHPDPAEIKRRITLLKNNWESLKLNTQKRLPPYETLKKWFKITGAPIRPEEIDLKRDEVLETIFKAQVLRNRFTILDLIYEAGVLSEVVEQIKQHKSYLF